PVPGTPASPTLLIESRDGGRRWSRTAELGPERVFALQVTSAGREPAIRAIGESGVHVGRPGAPWEHRAAPGGARFTSGSLGRDPRSGVRFAYATLPLARGGGAVAGGVQVSDDDGRSWKARNGSLLDAVREVGRGEGWGTAKGSLPSLGPISASAHFPL